MAARAAPKLIVLKVGSSSIVTADGAPARPLMIAVARAAAWFAERGTAMVVVSSGAIALGFRTLGYAERPAELPALQACAAVGQAVLMGAWSELFSWHGRACAQVLLTHDDVQDRRRYLNVRHALETLIERGAVPVINENDTVAVDEIKFGDNDTLAVLTAALLGAPTAVLVSDVAGLYDRDPRTPGATLIRDVRDLDAVFDAAGGSASAYGTGGMRAKLTAARTARAAGVTVRLGAARTADEIVALAEGRIGTTIHPADRAPEARKRWILSLKPAGAVTIDAGAARAVTAGRKSLLPSGVSAVEGAFERGDAVRVLSPDGRLLGVGLVEYGADELQRIRGAPSAEIAARLGWRYADEAIHRDHFVSTEAP